MCTQSELEMISRSCDRYNCLEKQLYAWLLGRVLWSANFKFWKQFCVQTKIKHSHFTFQNFEMPKHTCHLSVFVWHILLNVLLIVYSGTEGSSCWSAAKQPPLSPPRYIFSSSGCMYNKLNVSTQRQKSHLNISRNCILFKFSACYF